MQRIEGETVRVSLPPEKCESGLGKENKSPNPSQIMYRLYRWTVNAESLDMVSTMDHYS